MRKYLKLSISFMLLNTSIYAVSSPKDIEQFHATGTCIKCDLSGDPFLWTENSSAINLEGANLINSGISLSGDFNRQYSNFQNVFGYQLSILYGDFSYSTFNYANLTNARLIGMNLTGSNFTGANLSGVNFTESNLYQSIISAEQLKSVRIFCNTILPDGTVTDCNYHIRGQLESIH